VQLTYFGDYLIGKMFTIDFALVTSKKLVAEDWQDEVANDIAFLWSTLKVDDGSWLFHRRRTIRSWKT
jgi:hypothetical protein